MIVSSWNGPSSSVTVKGVLWKSITFFMYTFVCVILFVMLMNPRRFPRVSLFYWGPRNPFKVYVSVFHTFRLMDLRTVLFLPSFTSTKPWKVLRLTDRSFKLGIGKISNSSVNPKPHRKKDSVSLLLVQTNLPIVVTLIDWSLLLRSLSLWTVSLIRKVINPIFTKL